LRRRIRAALGPTTNRKLIVEVLKEMHHIVLDAGVDLGASAADGRLALALAAKDTRRKRPSLSVIEPSNGLAGALEKWRSDRRYRHPDGSPRVVAIKGKGATFETLARQFAPTLPLDKAVKMICDNAEVTRLKGDKLALLGSAVLISPKTPELAVASLALRIRRLADTAVFNAAIPAHVKGTGYIERLVTGVLTEKEFREFSRSVRELLQDVCDKVDARLKQPGPRNKSAKKRGRACGIGLYLFRDDGQTS
jgi:hypothetical protein